MVRNSGWTFDFYSLSDTLATALGFKGLEDFMANFWEKWACSKGAV